MSSVKSVTTCEMQSETKKKIEQHQEKKEKEAVKQKKTLQTSFLEKTTTTAISSSKATETTFAMKISSEKEITETISSTKTRISLPTVTPMITTTSTTTTTTALKRKKPTDRNRLNKKEINSLNSTLPHEQKKQNKESIKPPISGLKSKRGPPALIIIGMAGSGKTTLMQRLNTHVHQHKIPSYIINLDPAVHKLPYSANIDIRDTVNYKQVMKQYQLGPNGGIMTALNLFATRFDQVLSFVEKRAPKLEYIFVDTPGQIEVFTWSASGTIITDSLATAFPTVVIYVVDTPRSTSPVTFMSNMMYACSIMYKTKLPLLIVFNKIDVVSHSFAVEWMTNFDAFQAALRTDESYMSDLTRSMSLVMEEFYTGITPVGVSAVTGAGINSFFAAIDKSVDEYYQFYRPALDAKIENEKKKRAEAKAKNLDKLQKALKESKGQKIVLSQTKRKKKVWKEEEDGSESSLSETTDDDYDEKQEFDEFMTNFKAAAIDTGGIEKKKK